jgi:hypothetical protein
MDPRLDPKIESIYVHLSIWLYGIMHINRLNWIQFWIHIKPTVQPPKPLSLVPFIYLTLASWTKRSWWSSTSDVFRTLLHISYILPKLFPFLFFHTFFKRCVSAILALLLVYSLAYNLQNNRSVRWSSHSFINKTLSIYHWTFRKWVNMDLPLLLPSKKEPID